MSDRLFSINFKKPYKPFKNKYLITYKENHETFCHTATLLIHNLKYLSFVSLCFTKGKNIGRV